MQRQPAIQGLLIRPATQADASAIADLINDAFQMERDYLRDEPETALSVAMALNERDGYLVAECQEGLVGCVHTDVASRRISKLAVPAALRNRGVGKLLMAEAEALLRRNGVREIELGVLNFREELFKIYPGLGYVLTQRIGRPHSTIVKPCHICVFTKTVA